MSMLLAGYVKGGSKQSFWSADEDFVCIPAEGLPGGEEQWWLLRR